MDKKDTDHDIIDKDLYEEIDDKEMYEIVMQAREEILEREKEEKINPPPKQGFPKWVFWVIATAMILNIIAFLPQKISIPAIEFIKTSIRLSAQDDIKAYKQAVVVLETGDKRGTGFNIDESGLILTNYHVIEGNNPITVAFPQDGLFTGEIVSVFPEIDLAILDITGKDLPYLNLADQATFTSEEKINVIGNPLNFRGIVNEGNIIDYIRLKDWEDEVIMIQAPIYRGNSGSPIINKSGEVIGIVFATLETANHGKVGLFIPIDLYYQYYLSQ